MKNTKKVFVRFFKTELGNEPVREFLHSLSIEDKKSIGADIMAVEMLWPIGYPTVRKMDKDLWEINNSDAKRRSMLFFIGGCSRVQYPSLRRRASGY